MDEIFNKLAEYTLVLKEELDTTNQANEGHLITRLAAAAEMFAIFTARAMLSLFKTFYTQRCEHTVGRSYLGRLAKQLAKNGWHSQMRLAYSSKHRTSRSTRPKPCQDVLYVSQTVIPSLCSIPARFNTRSA